MHGNHLHVMLQDLVSRISKRLTLATNTRGGTVNYGPYKDVNDNYNDWPAAS